MKWFTLKIVVLWLLFSFSLAFPNVCLSPISDIDNSIAEHSENSEPKTRSKLFRFLDHKVFSAPISKARMFFQRTSLRIQSASRMFSIHREQQRFLKDLFKKSKHSSTIIELIELINSNEINGNEMLPKYQEQAIKYLFDNFWLSNNYSLFSTTDLFDRYNFDFSKVPLNLLAYVVEYEFNNTDQYYDSNPYKVSYKLISEGISNMPGKDVHDLPIFVKTHFRIPIRELLLSNIISESPSISMDDYILYDNEINQGEITVRYGESVSTCIDLINRGVYEGASISQEDKSKVISHLFNDFWFNDTMRFKEACCEVLNDEKFDFSILPSDLLIDVFEKELELFGGAYSNYGYYINTIREKQFYSMKAICSERIVSMSKDELLDLPSNVKVYLSDVISDRLIVLGLDPNDIESSIDDFIAFDRVSIESNTYVKNRDSIKRLFNIIDSGEYKGVSLSPGDKKKVISHLFDHYWFSENEKIKESCSEILSDELFNFYVLPTDVLVDILERELELFNGDYSKGNYAIKENRKELFLAMKDSLSESISDFSKDDLLALPLSIKNLLFEAVSDRLLVLGLHPHEVQSSIKDFINFDAEAISSKSYVQINASIRTCVDMVSSGTYRGFKLSDSDKRSVLSHLFVSYWFNDDLDVQRLCSEVLKDSEFGFGLLPSDLLFDVYQKEFELFGGDYSEVDYRLKGHRPIQFLALQHLISLRISKMSIDELSAIPYPIATKFFMDVSDRTLALSIFSNESSSTTDLMSFDENGVTLDSLVKMGNRLEMRGSSNSDLTAFGNHISQYFDRFWFKEGNYSTAAKTLSEAGFDFNAVPIDVLISMFEKEYEIFGGDYSKSLDFNIREIRKNVFSSIRDFIAQHISEGNSKTIELCLASSLVSSEFEELIAKRVLEIQYTDKPGYSHLADMSS